MTATWEPDINKANKRIRELEDLVAKLSGENAHAHNLAIRFANYKADSERKNQALSLALAEAIEMLENDEQFFDDAQRRLKVLELKQAQLENS